MVEVRRPSQSPFLRLAVSVAAAAAACFPAAAAGRPRVYALTGGTIVVAPGKTIEGGTLVLRDGLVEAVGRGILVPPDAVEIDAKGMRIYSGFIDASGRVPGAAEPAERPPRPPTGEDDAEDAFRAAAPPSPPTGPGAVHPVARVRPERQAEDLLQPYTGDRKRDLETLRSLGFTAVLAAPGPGIFRGRSAAILLQDDAPVPSMIVKRDVAQHVAFEYGSFGEGYPSSLMGAVALVRQTLLDALRDREWAGRYAKDPSGIPRPQGLPAWEALRPALDRRMPVVFQADDPADVLLADRIASEFDLDAVVAAGGYEGEILDGVAATRRPLLFPVRFPDKPKVADADEALDFTTRELRRFADAPSVPKRLRDAGVPFALTLRGLKNVADFPGNMRKILEAGLPEDAALAALTVEPAKLLGIDAVLGSLEPGKIANVVVVDGPLFGKDTKVRRVYVDGTEYVTEEKRRPKGDPGAVVDPRGTWSVVLEFGGQTVQRQWTIAGSKGAWTGSAETRSGTVAFDRVDLEGNALTVVVPAAEGRGPTEVTVIVTGDALEGTAEFGPRSATVRGTRTRGPEGGR